ncbi:NAD(P)H-dependent flavin oxidoreductase [Sphingobacterium faecale]|uniref:Propionate 3-nitronate monooxygenase n=1 Tax=Sphingobacterium faecale TaxID=2803775 RepID=A0ABS1R2M8_9SPHI|nr:nitronate monooxygenase [Sphingobacterium faecale]MBL1408292.1 nitronate monooxygenase [Sphingobacterium faecale]
MHWDEQLTRSFGTTYPIIQAPMFGVTTPEMVAATASAGCLGSLALGDMNAEGAVKMIRKVRALIDKSFAVNIFAHHIPAITDVLREQYRATKAFIEELAQEHDLDIRIPDLSEIKVNRYHELLDVILEEGCKIVSFTFGNLDDCSIDRLKKEGCLLIGTCTSVEEALILEKSGIDIICVQGIEAGGHRGSFDDTGLPKIGGFSLLAQVYDHVKVPLVYAGGLYKGEMLAAAQVLGARGFQVGSMLCASVESALMDIEKERLIAARETDIVLTKSFSGRYARGIRNTFTDAMDRSGYILPYPYQNKITGALRRVAKEQGNIQFLNIWAGQSLSHFSSMSTTDILRKLITEA